MNKGNMPTMSMTDEALHDRILTMPHRSKFTNKEELLNDPYTYIPDSTIVKKLPTWRPYCIMWQLEGLKMYYKDRFNTKIPRGCQEFKNSILAENDVVAQFVEDTLEYTGNEDDFLKAKDLYEYFKRHFEDFMRDKRTKVSITEFVDLLNKTSIGNDYHDRKMVNGFRYRSCYTKWKTVDDHCVL